MKYYEEEHKCMHCGVKRVFAAANKENIPTTARYNGWVVFWNCREEGDIYEYFCSDKCVEDWRDSLPIGE